MGTKTLEMNAVCVADWEADHLREINPADPTKGFLGGIASLIKDAGGTTVKDGVFSAFDSIEEDDATDREFWAQRKAEFQAETGLEVPPVMRVRVVVVVETYSPEESKRLWDAHTASLRLHLRAQDYANALQEEQEFYEGLQANLAAGRQPSPEELKTLYELRARVTKLQPHTLRWLITTKDGTVVQVETRDRRDWCDDHTNTTMVVGAFAEIPWRDPASNTAKVRECSYPNDGLAKRDRESDHRMAVEILGANNDWFVTSIARNGEVWKP